MKIVYIAHPIRGAVRSNVSRVERILESLLQKQTKIWPIAPYLDACRYLSDECETDRKRAFAANRRYLDAGLVDELWVCGKVSAGVRQEIDWAIALGISVVFKNFEELVR